MAKSQTIPHYLLPVLMHCPFASLKDAYIGRLNEQEQNDFEALSNAIDRGDSEAATELLDKILSEHVDEPIGAAIEIIPPARRLTTAGGD